MRNKILGGIGVLWGGAIVVKGLVGGAPAGADAAYQSGATGALLFGAVMFAAGLYAIFKKAG